MQGKRHSLMVFLFFTGYAIVYIDKTVIGFAILPIEREFSLRPEQLGYIPGIFFLAYSLFQIPAGWFADRFGSKKILLGSLFLLGGFAICFGWLGLTFSLLLTFRFLSGMGHAGYPTSCAKAISASFSIEKRTFAQSILLSSAGLAMTLGPLVAVYCLGHAGWRGSFISLGIIAFVVMSCIYFLIPHQQQEGFHSPLKQRDVSYRQLLKSPVVILLFISIFCLNIPSYGLMTWLPKFLVQSRGMSTSTSGLVAAAGGAGMWISSLCTGYLVGRYMQGKEHRVVCTSSLLSAVCIWLVYLSDSAMSAGLFLFLGYVFLMASFVTVFTLPMKRLPMYAMGAAMGIIYTGGTLGGFVAPIIMGYLVTMSQGYFSTFFFLVLVMVVSGLVLLPLAGKYGQFSSDATPKYQQGETDDQ